MKKIILTSLLSLTMVFAFCSCGNNEEAGDTEQAAETTTEAAATVQRDMPEGDYEEVGSGTFYISGPSGSTENGDEIIIYPDMDAIPFAFVDYELWDMDGSVLTYIYVDGVQVDKQQVGDGYQSSIDLQEEWQITEGDHVYKLRKYRRKMILLPYIFEEQRISWFHLTRCKAPALVGTLPLG